MPTGLHVFLGETKAPGAVPRIDHSGPIPPDPTMHPCLRILLPLPFPALIAIAGCRPAATAEPIVIPQSTRSDLSPADARAAYEKTLTDRAAKRIRWREAYHDRSTSAAERLTTRVLTPAMTKGTVARPASRL